MSQYVWIHAPKLEQLSQKLISQANSFPRWDGEQFLDSRSLEQIVQYFFIGNAMNFRFWYSRCSETYTYQRWRGSAAMWALLKDHPTLLDANYLSTLGVDQHPDLTRMPMGLERVVALREAGKGLIEHFDGNALEICTAADWHAPTLVDVIVEHFPMWRDECRGTRFNKRAQLFVAMLHGRLGSESPLTCVANLSCLADYQVPKGLRQLGVLEYAEELQRRVDTEVFIPSGSDEEYQIRKCTVEAVKELSRLVSRTTPCPPVQLDYLLWNAGRELRGPHHLTVTFAY